MRKFLFRKEMTMLLKILRQNISILTRRSKGTTSIEQKNGNGVKGNKTNNNGTEVNRNEDQNGSDNKSQAKKKPGVPGNGPLLQQTEVSTSQMDFFRMLDEKIENGPDYDESLDAASRAERAAILMRRWELASIAWTNSTSELANPSPVGSPNGDLSNGQNPVIRQNREGMRNIIGGRPESAPVYVTNSRNANRVDGLEDYYSPKNMPRHVLESITQSPTQSLKNSGARYQDYGDECDSNGEGIFKDQYLQQTGMAPFSTASTGVNAMRNNNSYAQQFPHFSGPRKRDFNAAQMT